MFLKAISLFNFRNYSKATLDFDSKFCCLTGDNGAGKTNILDAIYFLAFCKSNFNTPDSQIVRHKEGFFRLEAKFEEGESGKWDISCKYPLNGKKTFTVNDAAYDRLSDHIGLIPLVMLCPDDISLVNGFSEERRRFMDITLCQLSHEYLDKLMAYNRILQQRNALLRLKGGRERPDPLLLAGYDKQLLEPATYIYNKRKAFLSALSVLFSDYYRQLSGAKENVEARYRSHLDEAPMDDLLAQSLERDCILRRTNKGIHRDELELLIDGYPAKKLGSQGQKKSCLLALKLAQYHIIRAQENRKPILLLDDLFDKLDRKRVSNLFKCLNAPETGQIIITDTNEKRVAEVFSSLGLTYGHFRVEDGNIG